MDTNVEVPQFFICPISLDIMQDPVTVVTGITYDRSSIERWLFSNNKTTCPVTCQPLSKDSGLTPNHTLRRLIQAWCTINSVDRIPTPKPVLNCTAALSILSDLSNPSSLGLASSLASYNESNRRTLLQAGAARFLLAFIFSHTSCNNDQHETALNLLLTLKVPTEDLRPLVENNYDLIDALTLKMNKESNKSLKSVTVSVLKLVMELANASLLERLKVVFFQNVVSIMRDGISTQATKYALHVLLSASSHYGRNIIRMVEAGAVKEVIELELTGPDKRRTELVLDVLENLCSCAEGRAQLVEHAAGIAVVAERMLRVSSRCDESAVGILKLVCKHSGTKEVVREMMRVGGVSKLSFVLQADCSTGVKEKARWVLRLHSGVWKESNCFNFSLLGR